MSNQYIDVECPKCGTVFDVPGTMRGGLSNCPDCGKLVSIRSGPEIGYGLLVAGGVILLLALTTLFYFTGGVTSAGIAFGIGAVILAVTITVV